MAFPVSEVVISGSAAANSLVTATAKEIEYGPVAIWGIYVYATADIPVKLKVGNTVVWQGKATTTDWDRDQNKLTPVGWAADFGEHVEFELDNSGQGTATAYKIYVIYSRMG